ncbi:alpha beta-hydrolase [Pyrrhoderma noxium]|uniref:Alpha beta-hydrolase n=1 Tax=Pyrrhoderma noxium TaxID=2282107 RepID=A0A286ULW9_9AGAM|nr:alpha beta-hydrolase [Pyrrhoderma noxium]
MAICFSILLTLFSFVVAIHGSDVTTSTEELSLLNLPKRIARCHSTNRKEDVNVDIYIHYVDVNPSAPRSIIMVHGWPGLWSNWLHQIYAFKDEYHIVALDQRGFGSSTHPGDVQSSGTMFDLVGDLECVLKDAGIDSAICLGHDWGAQVCWEAARMRPDIFEAVAVAVVPYIQSSGPFVPMKDLAAHLPRLAYQIYFSDKTEEAVAELNKNIQKSLRSVYRSVNDPPPEEFLLSKSSFLDAYGPHQEIRPIPFMSTEEENYLIKQYSLQGFKHTLIFYTHENRYRSWEFSHNQGNHTITQPALAIYPTEDPVADWVHASKLLQSERYVPNLVVETIPAAHWVQIEKPEQFNEALRRWLNNLPKPNKHTEDKERIHINDEL